MSILSNLFPFSKLGIEGQALNPKNGNADFRLKDINADYNVVSESFSFSDLGITSALPGKQLHGHRLGHQGMNRASSFDPSRLIAKDLHRLAMKRPYSFYEHIIPEFSPPKLPDHNNFIDYSPISIELTLGLSHNDLFEVKLEANAEFLVAAPFHGSHPSENRLPAEVNIEVDGIESTKADTVYENESLISTLSEPLAESILDPEYVLAWNRQAFDTVARSSRGPTVAARLYSKLAEIQYDSWAFFDKNASGIYFSSLKQNDLTDLLAEAGVSDIEMSKFKADYESSSDSTKNLIFNSLRQSVISRGAHDVLVDIQKSMIDDADVLNNLVENANLLLRQQIADITAIVPSSSHLINEISIDLSNKISSVLLEEARQDGSNQLGLYSDTSGYVPTTSVYEPTSSAPVLDSEWQPLLGQVPLTPHWGNVKPFAIDVDQVLPEGVVSPYLDSGLLNLEYIDEINEVLDFSLDLSPTQKAIAEYWEGGDGTGTPPGIWLKDLGGLIVSRALNLDDTIELNLKATQAMYDASIAVWNTKYHFNTVRPGTSIRQFYAEDQLNDGLLGADFESTLPVPPFPDIPSGHSAFSASFNSVLIDFFGNNTYGGSVVLADDSSLYSENGFDGLEGVGEDIVLTWDTFSQAAGQAGLSRLYGGIHTRSGDLIGQIMGYKIGSIVTSKVDQLLYGSSPSFEADHPKQNFGTMKSDLISVDHNSDGFSVQELYGFRGNDTLVSSGDSSFHLYGGMGVDEFQIGINSDVTIRDYEYMEQITLSENFLDDDSLGQILFQDSGTPEPFTDVMIGSRRLVRLDGAWDQSEVKISVADDAKSEGIGDLHVVNADLTIADVDAMINTQFINEVQVDLALDDVLNDVEVQFNSTDVVVQSAKDHDELMVSSPLFADDTFDALINVYPANEVEVDNFSVIPSFDMAWKVETDVVVKSGMDHREMMITSPLFDDETFDALINVQPSNDLHDHGSVTALLDLAWQVGTDFAPYEGKEVRESFVLGKSDISISNDFDLLQATLSDHPSYTSPFASINSFPSSVFGSIGSNLPIFNQPWQV